MWPTILFGIAERIIFYMHMLSGKYVCSMAEEMDNLLSISIFSIHMFRERDLLHNLLVFYLLDPLVHQSPRGVISCRRSSSPLTRRLLSPIISTLFSCKKNKRHECTLGLIYAPFFRLVRGRMFDHKGQGTGKRD